MIHAIGIFIATLLPFTILIRKYKKDTIRRANKKVAKKVAKKEKVSKKNATFCCKTPFIPNKAFKLIITRIHNNKNA